MEETVQHLTQYQKTLNDMGTAQSDTEYEQALIQNEAIRDALLADGHQFHFGENGAHVWSVKFAQELQA